MIHNAILKIIYFHQWDISNNKAYDNFSKIYLKMHPNAKMRKNYDDDAIKWWFDFFSCNVYLSMLLLLLLLKSIIFCFLLIYYI